VSIIMPVWQPRPEWLHAAVDSALGQTRCRLELVVVDDGCPVPVASLLEGYRDDRLRVLRIEHSGHAGAVNAGMAHARGDWIRFADADDILEPDSTSHLGGMMDGDRVIAYGATLVCDEGMRPDYSIVATQQGNVVVDCLLGRFRVRHPALLFPRRVMEEAGPWDPGFRVSADWDFVLRALDHAPVRGDQVVAFRYRRHTRSLTGTGNIDEGQTERSRVIARYIERHPEQRGTVLERRAWAATYVAAGTSSWSAGRYSVALRRFTRALAVEPFGSAAKICLFALRRARGLSRAAWLSIRGGG